MTGFFHLAYFLKDFIYLFLERGEGREKERERNINVWLPLTHPPLGTWPETQACVLTGNRTGDPLVRRLALSPVSHTIMFLRFSHVVVAIHTSFLFTVNYSIVWIFYIPFIHSSVGRHVGGFHFLVILNHATMNICVQFLCGSMCHFS